MQCGFRVGSAEDSERQWVAKGFVVPDLGGGYQAAEDGAEVVEDEEERDPEPRAGES